MFMSQGPEVASDRFGLEESPAAELTLEDADQTVNLGRAVGGYAEAGDVVGLIGALGSGKTTLVSGIAEALGSDTPATSPTYTLVHRHESRPPMIHVDLYRLESVDGLETTGYWDFVRARNCVVCVEWLNRIPEAWPGDGLIVALRYRAAGRVARIWPGTAWSDRLDSLIEQWRGEQ